VTRFHLSTGKRALRILAALTATLALTLSAPASLKAGQVLLDQLFTAQEWQAKGNMEAARRAVEAALKASPGDVFARIRLAQLDAVSGDTKAALATLGQALQDDPGNLLALLWQGHLLLADGQSANASASYAAILKADPASAWAHLGTAACLLAQGRDKDAAGPLAKAQANAGGDALLRRVLGETFLALGLPVNARLELERSLESSPRDVRALTLAGQAYLALGLESLAMNAWRQALALEPGADGARFALLTELGRQASMAAGQGHKDEARRIWRTMLTYDPLEAAALNGLRSMAPASGALPVNPRAKAP